MVDAEVRAFPSTSTMHSSETLDKTAVAMEMKPEPQPVVDDSVPQEESTPALPPAPKPKRQIMLLPSVFEGRPPVLFFTYTVACGAPQRPLERLVHADIDGPKLYYSHTDAVHEYNAVINTLRQGGLYRVRSENPRWSLLWSNHPPPELLRSLKTHQKTNHFPGSWHLGRKDLLWKNISRFQRRLGRVYQITPQAYVLPKGSAAWETARMRQPDALWIWKPCSQSCGRGIKVLSSNIPEDESKELSRKRGIVQRYVPDPLLINGYKFDLRIYVVVVSYEPLKVYINHEGLVRLATEKYSANPDTLDVRTMHLTNYSVNKLNPAFVQNKDGRDAKDDQEQFEAADEEDEAIASKWSLAELRTYFEQNKLDYDAMFARIKDVVIKTLIAVEPALSAEWCKSLEDEDAGWAAKGPAGAHPASCFEMYGFDVLVDSSLKPWLLEVNICPSLSSGSPLDKRIKTQLVADTFTLVGIRPPPIIWRNTTVGAKRTSSDMTGTAVEDMESLVGCMPSAQELAKRAAQLAAASPTEALALFDELAWEAVLTSHDEDMRCGSLERIFPTAESAQYTEFLGQESYLNLVLRKWYEAGGGELFRMRGPHVHGPHPHLPPWVPRQICFTKT